MRRRIDITETMEVEGRGVLLYVSEVIDIEDVRLIVDETQKKVICSSMQKDNVTIESTAKNSIILVPSKFGASKDDVFTVEIDTADKLSDVTSSINTAITSAQSALLGEDTTATQTAILQAVATAVQDAAEMNKQAYSARFEQNTDTDNSYTLVLPIIAGVDETTQTATL